MELHQLRCFLAVAEELHFGRAARQLDMMPSALGRHIRLLEESLGTQLLLRTTRNVSLSQDGAVFLDDARALVTKADSVAKGFREKGRKRSRSLKLGAIDTAAAGLVPLLLQDFRTQHPKVSVQLVEDKTIRLLPRLLSGRLDVAFVRPPEQFDKRLQFELLFHETAVVALPTQHKLAARKKLAIENIVGEPLIIPDRSSRPHSHDLTMKLFDAIGEKPIVAQIAEEKQTIVNLVAAGLGLAIVPKWASRFAVAGVRFVPLDIKNSRDQKFLPFAAAWVHGSRDPVRDQMLDLLKTRLKKYTVAA